MGLQIIDPEPRDYRYPLGCFLMMMTCLSLGTLTSYPLQEGHPDCLVFGVSASIIGEDDALGRFAGPTDRVNGPVDLVEHYYCAVLHETGSRSRGTATQPISSKR